MVTVFFLLQSLEHYLNDKKIWIKIGKIFEEKTVPPSIGTRLNHPESEIHFENYSFDLTIATLNLEIGNRYQHIILLDVNPFICLFVCSFSYLCTFQSICNLF